MSPVAFSGAARVGAVLGRPITHSLSPLLHNAWIRALDLDAVYIPLAPQGEDGFKALIRACRGGMLCGVNVTAPYKEHALALSDNADAAALASGSANLLTFDEEGRIFAQSTDGHGLTEAIREQAAGFDFTVLPAVVLGAGGAARAAVSALLAAGAPEVRVVNRTLARAEELVFAFKTRVTAFDLGHAAQAFSGAGLLVNAASGGPLPTLELLPDTAVVMDMTYRPLMTPLLQSAAARGLRTVDGLAMLIHQARPSFEALFGVAPPEALDIRALALASLANGSPA
jgi:shikimate dehydrogenase